MVVLLCYIAQHVAIYYYRHHLARNLGAISLVVVLRSRKNMHLCTKRLLGMKEELASDLLEIAEFYERTKKGKAAAIYYATILKKYPETKAAKKSEKRLKVLDVPNIYSKKNPLEEDAIVVDATE